MGGYTRQAAAERAGVAVEDVDRLVELEIMVPEADGRFSAGAVRKIGFITSLRAGGLPIDAVAAQMKTGRLSFDFLDNPAFDYFSALSRLTFEDLAARTGIPVDLLLVIREAIGSAVAEPTDYVKEIELEIVPLIEAELAIGYPPHAAERLLRTMADSLRRFVLAEAEVFRTQVIGSVAERSGPEISAAGASASERIAGPMNRALLAIHGAQLAHAWTANILEGWERDLAEAGLYSQPDRPPAMCFLDITGYTRLTAERGDKAAAELAGQLTRIVQRTSVGHGGRPVKWLGDGVMLYFRDPGPAVVASLEMADRVRDAGLPPAHVGLHAGPVLFQDGDYFGQTVNLASRIAEYARPGEVLASRTVVDAAVGAPVRFVAVGPVELKGLAGTVDLYIAHRASSRA